MADLAALVVRLEADASKYLSSLDQATKSLKKFQADQESLVAKVADKIKEIGTELVAAFAFDKLVEFTASALESSAALEKLSQQSGISTESLSGLNLAFAASGLSQDELGTSLKKLNSAISEAAGNATSKAGAAFRTMGISVRDASGNIKDSLEIQSEIADYFAKTADGANKTALAIALFGREGQKMIPQLNEGSAALAEYQKAAEEWGIAISGPAAAAAETFSKSMLTLKAEVIGSLSQQLATALIPALQALVDDFTAAGTQGEALGAIADALATTIKLIATAVIIVVGQFKGWAEAVLGVGKAFYDLNTLQWDKIGGDLGKGFDDSGKTIANSFSAVRDMWEAGTKDALNYISTAEAASKKVKVDPGSLTGTEQMDAADKKLQEFAKTLAQTNATFGLGGAALEEYKLHFGSLSDDYSKASVDGKKAADAALAYARALQLKQDTKTGDDLIASLVEQTDTLDASAKAAFTYKINTGTLGEALDRLAKSGHDLRPAMEAAFDTKLVAEDSAAIQKINDEIAKTAGNLKDAGTAAFDLTNKSLKQNLTDTGDDAGLKALDTRRAQIAAEDQYQELVAKSKTLEADLAKTEDQIALARAQHTITDLEAQGELSDAQNKELVQLQAVYASMKNLSDNSGIPALTQQTAQFQNQLIQLQTKAVDPLVADVQNNLEKAFANNFADLITGAKSFRDALTGFLKDIEKMFVDMIAKQYAQKLFGTNGPGGGLSTGIASLFGSQSGSGAGSAGSLLGGLGSLFGGGSGIASTGADAIGSTAMDTATAGVASNAGSVLDAAVAAMAGHATGGTMPSHSFAMVGENGPEVAYSGSQDLHIQPMSSAKKAMNVTNHFTVNSATGNLSRQSQTQMAAETARQLSMANRRNN